MVSISEWLPNPEGKDSDGEWFELVNTGDVDINLSGWHVAAGGEKKYALSGVIASGEHRVFSRNDIKMSLRNTDGEVSLYAPGGSPADHASFVGVAPEGKSAQRIGRSVAFVEPTPGGPYKGNPYANMLQAVYSPGTSLARGVLGQFDIFTLFLGAGVALAALMLYIAKHNAYLSELFFPSDQGDRG